LTGESPQVESAFATRVVAHEIASAFSAESDTVLWKSQSAIGGFSIEQTPRGNEGELARFLMSMWPLLDQGAVEVRWLASAGNVRCALFMRASDADADTARGECAKRLQAAEHLATSILTGWSLAPLDDAALESLLEPFEAVDAGDLVRREIEVELGEDAETDVPLLLGVNPNELGLLVEELARSEHPAVVSLAAAPVELDEAELAVLHSELASLERSVVGEQVAHHEDYPSYRHDTPASRLSLAAQILQRRIIATERVGFLRVSLASAGPISLALRAAAQDALSAIPEALAWVPAFEPADREVFSANLRTIGFTPWGVQAAEQAGHENVNDCYLASLDEIVSELVVPIADGFMPLAHTMVDPAPRPVHSSVAREGRVIGFSAEDPRRGVALSEGERTRHTYVVGQTGTGKSALLLNLALQDIEAGQGVCVVDPHGDLVDAILERYPRSRSEDLVLVDPSDRDRIIGLNPLEPVSDAADMLIQQLIGMLYRIYDPFHTGIIGPRFEHWFRNAAETAIAHPDGGVLMDIPRLFTDDRFLASRLQYVQDPAIRSFWIEELGATSDFHKSEMVGWFIGKFGAFNSNEVMRGIVGQRKSTIDIPGIMDESRVLLVKLPRGLLGEINAMWLGMMLISKIQMSALGRASRAPGDRRLFNLYVDEFQNFAYTEFDSLIAEARKYGLALTLAHQHVGQLTAQIRDAVIGNVATWVLFRMGLADAEVLQSDIEGFSARDLAKLQNRRCVVRTSVDGNPVPPFDILTLDPDRWPVNSVVAESLTQLSQLKYGVGREVVDAEYARRWEGSISARSEKSAEQPDAPSMPEPETESAPDSTSALASTPDLVPATEPPAYDGPDAPPSRTPDDIPRLLARWNMALDSLEPGAMFNAARDLAHAYVADGRADQAVTVLCDAHQHIDVGGHFALRRALVVHAARIGGPGQTRVVMRMFALEMLAQDGADELWSQVYQYMGKVSGAVPDSELRGYFDRLEAIATGHEQTTWADLLKDPMFV
jgi:hypothetical protein